MRDVGSDAAALERLRVQRIRLADRMRPPWWYLPGAAIGWTLAFAAPFGSRFLPQGVSTWPILVATLAVFYLLQRGLARATGIALATRTLRYPSGRPAGIAIIVVMIAVVATETVLIRRGLLVAAIVVAALAVVVEVAGQQAHLRGIRQDLRAGRGAA
jgi:hypothetical protein